MKLRIYVIKATVDAIAVNKPYITIYLGDKTFQDTSNFKTNHFKNEILFARYINLLIYLF